MKACFRVDASSLIGSGHVYRCMTLAAALKRDGADCVFVCRKVDGDFIQFIAAAGYKVVELEELDASLAVAESDDAHPYHSGLMTSETDDAKETLSKLRQCGISDVDLLIVDHYAISETWERAFAGFASKVIVIDDLADRAHSCDLLIDQTLDRTPLSYEKLIPVGARILTGSKFALLRPEFAELRNNSLKRRNNNSVKHVVVFFGAVDTNNYTLQTVRVLSTFVKKYAIKPTVILGRNCKLDAELEHEVAQNPESFSVISATENIGKIYSECDLAIGAAGTSAWERCSLGLPALMVIVAENQREVAKSLSCAKAVRILEDGEGFSDSLIRNMQDLLHDPKLLSAMSKNSSLVTDGRGTDRLCKVIMGHG